MKPNLNPKYIKYKGLFNTSAYYQRINKNLVKLLIINNNLNIFPKFIYHVNYTYDAIEVRINIERLAVIVANTLRVTYDKYNETES